MQGKQKELLTILKLDDVDFKKGLSSAQKDILGVSASVGALGVAMLATAKYTADFDVEMLHASRSAGQSVETFSAMAHVAETAGVSMEDLSKATRKLITPTDDMKTKLAQFGISLTDTRGAMKSQTSLLDEISKKYQALPIAADKAALAVAAFGEDGGKITNVLAQDIRALTKEAEDMGIIVTTQAAKAAEKFNHNIDTLSGSVKGLRNHIGDSIIAFVNQTGIMEKAAKAVQFLTKWWDSFSDNTKNIIIGVGLVIAALGVLTVAILAMVPIITAAETAMTGGINLIVIAVVAFAAEVAAAVAYIGLNFGKFEKFFSPVVAQFEKLKESVTPIVNAFKAFGEAASGLKIFSDILKLGKDMDIWATGIKAALVLPITGILIFSAVLGDLIKSLKAGFEVGSAFVDILKEIGIMASQPFGKFDPEAAAKSMERLKDAGERLGKGFGDFQRAQITTGLQLADDVAKVLENIYTKTDVAAKKTAESVKEIEKGATQVPPAFEGIKNSIYDVAKSASTMVAAFKFGHPVEAMEAMKGVVEGLSGAFVEMLKGIQALAEVKLTNLKQSLDFGLGAFKAVEAARLQAFNDMIDAELKTIADQKAAIEAEEKRHQQKLKEIRDAYAIQRKAELDAEAQAEFARMQLLFEAQVAAIQATNQMQVAKDAEKTAALADLEDKKNQLIAESQDRLASDIDDQATAQQIAEEQRAAANEKLQDDLAARAAELEKQKADAAEASAKRQEDAAKQKSLTEWQAGKAAFEAGKSASVMQAQVGMAMGLLSAVQAAVMIAATIPVVGMIIGPVFAGVMAGLVLASGAKAIQVAHSAKYPPPPLFAAGGMATSPSIFGEAGAELAIPMDHPRGDFGDLKNAVASQLTSGVKGGVHIDELVINNTFMPRDDADDVMDAISEGLMDRIRSAVPA